MIKKKKIKKWCFLIINDFILALCIYLFTSGIKLNTGGIDGLSILTLQLFQLLNIKIDHGTKDIIFNFFMIFYNILSLIIGYKFFGKKFLFKTFILLLILHISLFCLVWIFGESENNLLLKIMFNNKNYLVKMFFYSIISGFFIGLTLSNIIKMGYTTGGMDIFHKILKDIYKMNFNIILFITDGLIIFFSSFFQSIITKYNNNFDYSIFFKDLIIRLFCSFLSILVIGYIMEKNFSYFHNKKK
ncbi:YitT family protein [Candidatus Phytoplasma oryzae]|nr:YitT family protein [Candidatus Phytoplasma oryzae]